MGIDGGGECDVNCRMSKHKIYPRNTYSFWTKMHTRWRDLDGLRHINHAAYLTYMETARLDYYHHLGFDYKRWDMESSTILASMEVDYLDQTDHPSLLEIGQIISRVGTKSFDILTAVFKAGEESPLAQARFTLVAFNYKRNETIQVPDIFRQEYRPVPDE